jgi:hypothetical protein
MYSVWNELDAFQSRNLKLGDLDGDGRSDLVAIGNQSAAWSAEPHVVFLDAAGEPKNVRDIQVAMNSLTLLPMPSADSQFEQMQLAGATEIGITTLEANNKQQITSVPNPFHTMPAGWGYRMVRVRGVSNSPQRERVLIYDSDGAISESEQHLTVAVLGRPHSDLAGTLVAGNVIDDEQSPCDEVVLTFGGDPNVYLLEACDANARLAPLGGTVSSVAQVPQGSVGVQGAMLAFVNGDTHLDLVVANSEHPSTTFVAFGDGRGTFSADPAFPTLTAQAMWPVTNTRVTRLENGCERPIALGDDFPLAIGDLNNDSYPDWVVPKGVAFSQPLEFDRQQAAIHIAACLSKPSATDWSIAAITNVNHDEFPDLVAGSAKVPDLDFLIGTGQSSLNRMSLRTAGPVLHMATGDFDGDLTTDVAVVESLARDAAALTAPTHSLAIAFGDPLHVPTPPIEVARFATESVHQLLAANYESDDRIQELGLLSQSKGGLAQQLMLFIGNAGRLPIAPLGLWNFTDQPPLESVIGWPLAMNVGHFMSATLWSAIALARNDNLLGTCPSRLNLWSVHDVQQVDAPPNFSRCLPVDTVSDSSNGAAPAAFIVTGHLDSTDSSAAPIDDALLVGTGPGPGQISVWRILVPAIEMNDFEPLTSAAALATFDGVLGSTASPMLLDLDSDGDRDLVVLFETPSHEQALNVLWNDGSNFAGVQPTRIEIPGSALSGLARHRTADGEHLLGVSQRGVFEISSKGVFPLTDDHSLNLPGGDAIASGDMTGDGLPDLAVSGAGKIRLYRQAPWAPGLAEVP